MPGIRTPWWPPPLLRKWPLPSRRRRQKRPGGSGGPVQDLRLLSGQRPEHRADRRRRHGEGCCMVAALQGRNRKRSAALLSRRSGTTVPAWPGTPRPARRRPSICPSPTCWNSCWAAGQRHCPAPARSRKWNFIIPPWVPRQRKRSSCSPP